MNTKTKSQPAKVANMDSDFHLENAMTELEGLVQQMESGQLSLNESLHAYQQGTHLLQQCQLALANIEQKIQIIDQSNNLKSFVDE